MKQRYRATSFALVVFINLLFISACNLDLTSGMGLGTGLVAPFTTVSVLIQNSSSAIFSIDTGPISVGALRLHRAHFSSSRESGASFDILRSRTLARVSYNVLRFPTLPKSSQTVIIIITEPSAGVFGASTPDSTSSWIQVLSVQSL